ncbi:MAG: fibronectin type III domain-containing protein, partial [Caldilineaceae bacterium SB0662_bin_25]|nr:fibronectin type III domain-containing protein [Caldilineaceae bacterium SB0662_bin_25]
MELSWTAVTGAVRYVLWEWGSANEWRQIGGDSLTGTSYTHTDVVAGTTYWYALRALNAFGHGGAFA